MPASPNRYTNASLAAGAFAVAVGLAVLTGWWLDIAWLKSLAADWATMKVNTALGFLLAGASLLLCGTWPAVAPNAFTLIRRLASVAAVFVAMLGLFTLIEHQTGIDLNIDEWLMRDLPADSHATHPGRMAPATAVSFLMLGVALLLANYRFRYAVEVSQLLALAVLLVGIVALTGYGYGVAAMYSFTATSSMALHTAALFAVLGVGALLARPQHGFMAAIVSAGSGGSMARRVLPWVVMLPLFAGWLSLSGVRFDWVQTEFGFAIFAVSCVAILAMVVVRHAQKLNITDTVLRSHADQAISAELRFRQIIEAAPGAMIMVDVHGHIRLANAQTEKLFGYTSTELLNRKIDMLVPDRARSTHAANRDRYNQTPEARAMGSGRDLYGRHKDGREIPVEIGLNPFTTADGTFVIAMVSDITIRHRMESTLRASEERLRFALATIHAGAWDLDLVSHKASCSVDYGRIFGYAEPLSDWSYEKFLDHVHSDDRSLVSAAFARACVTQGDLNIECRIRRVDGQVLDIRAAGRHIANDSGELLRMVGIVQDITEQKLAEEEQRALVQQLHQAQKLETVGRLTAGIAHDFNNILASVLGYTELALETQVPDKHGTLAGYLRQVEQAGVRARNLVANMLAFTRNRSAARQSVRLGPLVKEVAGLLGSTLPSSMEFVTRIEAPDSIVMGDPARLHQVIMNLAINARDAAGEHGRIELAVREVRDVHATCGSCCESVVGDFVELSVSDTGPGILPDTLTRIFEPFFTTKPTGKGTGMGLSVVHGVVHDSGGHVLVKSNQGAGTLFRMLLPFPERAVMVEDPLQEVTSQAQSGSGHILVVDDEVALAQLIAVTLKENGYGVTIFNSSQQALEEFRFMPTAFDAVVSDQTMPGLTGVDLTQALRALRPDLPIILCTGYSASLDESVAAQLKVTLMHKPVRMHELLRTLQSVLAESRETRATAVTQV